MINNKYILILFLLLLTSCKGRFIVDSYEAEESFIREESRSCNISGYCYSCGLDFNGDFSCGMRYSSFCDGHRHARVKVTPYYGHYEKEPDIRIRAEETEVIEYLSECEE
jgi:hypothetical protein